MKTVKLNLGTVEVEIDDDSQDELADAIQSLADNFSMDFNDLDISIQTEENT